MPSQNREVSLVWSCIISATVPWEWIKTYWLYTPLKAIKAIRASSTCSKSRPCSPGCLQEKTLGGGGQGGVHRAHDLAESMKVVGKYLEWERILYVRVHLSGWTPGSSNAGLARRCSPRCKLPVTDVYTFLQLSLKYLFIDFLKSAS